MTASVIARPPSAVGRYSAVGDRAAPVGPASMPARPFLMPSRQPTLPELQSVSQPEVLAIISERLEVVVAVEQGQDDQRVVRAPCGSCRRTCRSRSVAAIRSRVAAPVGLVGVPLAHVVDQAAR